MTKDEIKELHANLISLVPSDIRKSKELTKSDKILLGQLVFLYGMNKAKENGYVFRSNALLKEDTQLSKRSVSLAISHLIAYGAINRTVGSRADGASVYTLNFALPQNGESSPITSKVALKSSPITSKVALKSSPINQPYVSRAEVEAMIEGLRAEYEQQISELRDELATLKGMKSAEVALKSSPINGVSSPKSSPQIQNSEITYHSVPEVNYREGNIYTRTDGKKNDEAVETVGSVCDFQKNRVEGVETPKAKETTPITPANEIDPLNVEDDEVFLSTLVGNLRSGNTTLHPDEVIDLTKRLSEILTKQGDDYNTPTSRKAVECFGLLLNFHCKTLDFLAQLEDVMNGNLYHTNGKNTIVLSAITIRRADIKEESANKASGSVADTAEVQTTTDDKKTQQGASQRVNQGSGDTDTIPHDGETSQASENKAAGSVSAPQMGKLSTQTEKTRQMRPDEAREAMTVDIPTDRMLAKFANLNEVYDPLLHNGESEAEKVAIQVCKRCEKIETIEGVNWCLTAIHEILNRHGKILGSRAGIYLNAAVNALNRRREELLVA